MAEQIFSIKYQLIEAVSFPSSTGMRKYLAGEAEIWSPFLKVIRSHGQLRNIPLNTGGPANSESLASAFDSLIKRLEDVDLFNRSTQPSHGNIALPPPSTSLEGQLILGLHGLGREDDAVAAYIWFIADILDIRTNPNDQIVRMKKRGAELSVGAYAAAALPFRNITSQKLAGTVRSAEAQVQSLGEEVESAQRINNEHADEMSGLRSNWRERAKRIEALIIRRERLRRVSHDRWARAIDEEVENKFAKAESRLSALGRANEAKQNKHQAEFDKLLDLFHSQLRLKAPVELWEKRADAHSKKSILALWIFGTLTGVAIFAGAAIPYCAGDYIAESFFVQNCNAADPPVCERDFSAKGPLTVAGILTIMSLFMWIIRLQYRVFLSERHLSLDASEKQAFAETYLAMKEGGDVTSDHEAIVLSSLFRPTQDGIIKDDESTLDLSATAIIAKQMSRGGG